MRNKDNRRGTASTLVGACAIVLFLSGCGTSESAMQLAQVTSENTAALSGQLGRLEQASRRVSEERAKIVTFLESTAADSRRLATRDIGALVAVNDPRAEILKRLRAFLEENAASRESLQQRREVRITAVLSERQSVNPPSKQLNEIAKQLAKLAKESSFEEQVIQLAEFVAVVIESVEVAAKNGEKAGKNAEIATKDQTKEAKAVSEKLSKTDRS